MQANKSKTRMMQDQRRIDQTGGETGGKKLSWTLGRSLTTIFPHFGGQEYEQSPLECGSPEQDHLAISLKMDDDSLGDDEDDDDDDDDDDEDDDDEDEDDDDDEDEDTEERDINKNHRIPTNSKYNSNNNNNNKTNKYSKSNDGNYNTEPRTISNNNSTATNKMPAGIMQNLYSNTRSPPHVHNQLHNNNNNNNNNNSTNPRNRQVRRRVVPRKTKGSDFEVFGVLGKGTSACVYHVRHKRSRKNYAMKVVCKQSKHMPRQVQHAMMERNVLSDLPKHPFIVKMSYSFQTPRSLNFIVELCTGGELYFHLSHEGTFAEERARMYAAEVALALEHLHSHKTVYRDLKTENVLLDANGHVKIADFGLSKRGVDQPHCGATTVCGTSHYLAPEILSRAVYGRPVQYGTAVDWWTLGVLVFEMLTGMPPFFHEQPSQQFRNICQDELIFPLDMSNNACDFIRGLLERDISKRLGSQGGAAAVKSHPFFASVDFEALLMQHVPAPWVPDHETIYVEPSVWKSSTENEQSTEPETVPVPVPVPVSSSTKLAISGMDDVNSSANILSNRMANVSLFQGFSYTASSLASVMHVSASPPHLSGAGSITTTGGHTPGAFYHKRRNNQPRNSPSSNCEVGEYMVDSTAGSLVVDNDGHNKEEEEEENEEHDDDADLQGTFAIELDGDEDDVQNSHHHQMHHQVIYASADAGAYDEPFNFEL